MAAMAKRTTAVLWASARPTAATAMLSTAALAGSGEVERVTDRREDGATNRGGDASDQNGTKHRRWLDIGEHRSGTRASRGNPKAALMRMGRHRTGVNGGGSGNCSGIDDETTQGTDATAHHLNRDRKKENGGLTGGGKNEDELGVASMAAAARVEARRRSGGGSTTASAGRGRGRRGEGGRAPDGGGEARRRSR